MFKCITAVGEDPIHLPIRLEYCWGGKISKTSKRVRELHRKLLVGTVNHDRFWQPEDKNDTAAI